MFRYSLIVLIFAVSLSGCSKRESSKESTEHVNQVDAEQGKTTAGRTDEDVTKVTWDIAPMPEGAEGTFVVAAKVVFIRDEPDKVWPQENMGYSQLQDEYWDRYESFPHKNILYYGENVTGVRDKQNPDVVKTKTGYIDVKKLWHEPSLAKISEDRGLTVHDTKVYLIPDKKSPTVMSLFQGEVVETVGQLESAGDLWIKTSFCNQESHEHSHCDRYGYIESKDIEILKKDKIDESHLTSAEIPTNIRNSKLSFSDSEREFLSKNGFFINPPIPSSNLYVDDMADLYQDTSSSVFVTSDLFLHTFHLIFDRMLQDIEEEKLFPAVQSLTLRLINETNKDIKSAKDEKVQRALLHNLIFFSVAAKLFDPQFAVSTEVRSDVNAIVDRIVKAGGQLPSLEYKLELGNEDFTQYRVRGHYQKKTLKTMDENGSESVKTDDLLERYFRGMMWYGRHAIMISDDRQTLSAILMVRALENSGGMKEWSRIDSVLTKLIGKTDDWTPRDFANVNSAIYGKKVVSLDEIIKGGDKAIADFKAKAAQMLQEQKIVSVQTGTGNTQSERIIMTAGFKFLGQRFTWDAYIFNQLTSPLVGSDVKPRNLPSSLDVMYVLGSKAAEDLQSAQKLDNYHSQAEKLMKEIKGETEKRETTYNALLDTFKSLFFPTKSRQLFALQSPWQFKELNSALGSWTELKHDTILYTEQSMLNQVKVIVFLCRHTSLPM